MAGLIDFVIPREKKFFDHLYDQVNLLNDCIGKLNRFSKNSITNSKNQKKTLIYILRKRDKSVEISKNVVNSLHQTFITPIDRGEIKSLSLHLNQVIDSVKKITESICYFKIEKIDQYLARQINYLKKSSQILASIFKNPLLVRENCQRIESIRRIENQADNFYRRGVEYLFTNGHDPIQIIKQRELYEIAEEAIDKIDNIADIWETVLINHA